MATSKRIWNIGIPELSKMTALSNFFERIKYENRFKPTQDDLKIIGEMISFAKKFCTDVVPEKTLLYRARIHSYQMDNKAIYNESQIGAPPPDLAKGGRLNPTGIPYLYLSKEKDTAIYETRPWIGAQITVGVFETYKKLTILNTTTTPGQNQVTEDHKTISFSWLLKISEAFSIPTHPEDFLAYFPTQFLAEYFKDFSFDGILYRSSVFKGGHNIALYDPNNARCIQREKFKITNMIYKFKEASYAPEVS